MPTLSEIINDKLGRLQSVPDKFEDNVSKVESKVLTQILALVSDLDREKGKIKSTKGNLKKALTIVNKLKSILNKTNYNKFVKAFAKEFDAQAKLNNEIFKKQVSDFKPNEVAKEIIKEQKKEVAKLLISTSVIKREFQDPIKKALFKSIANNGTLKDLVKELRLTINGDKERLGLLSRYVKQIAGDFFSQSDANQTFLNSESAGIEFYQYKGRNINATRDFCRDRAGNFYHVQGLRELGTTPSEWQGRIPGTNPSNIFQNRGGYNCRHAFVPRSAISVPKEVLLDAIERGWYNPSDDEREALGI